MHFDLTTQCQYKLEINRLNGSDWLDGVVGWTLFFAVKLNFSQGAMAEAEIATFDGQASQTEIQVLDSSPKVEASSPKDETKEVVVVEAGDAIKLDMTKEATNDEAVPSKSETPTKLKRTALSSEYFDNLNNSRNGTGASDFNSDLEDSGSPSKLRASREGKARFRDRTRVSRDHFSVRASHELSKETSLSLRLLKGTHLLASDITSTRTGSSDPIVFVWCGQADWSKEGISRADKTYEREWGSPEITNVKESRDEPGWSEDGKFAVSSCIPKTLDPTWDEELYIDLADVIRKSIRKEDEENLSNGEEMPPLHLEPVEVLKVLTSLTIMVYVRDADPAYTRDDEDADEYIPSDISYDDLGRVILPMKEMIKSGKYANGALLMNVNKFDITKTPETNVYGYNVSLGTLSFGCCLTIGEDDVGDALKEALEIGSQGAVMGNKMYVKRLKSVLSELDNANKSVNRARSRSKSPSLSARGSVSRPNSARSGRSTPRKNNRYRNTRSKSTSPSRASRTPASAIPTIMEDGSIDDTFKADGATPSTFLDNLLNAGPGSGDQSVPPEEGNEEAKENITESKDASVENLLNSGPGPGDQSAGPPEVEESGDAVEAEDGSMPAKHTILKDDEVEVNGPENEVPSEDSDVNLEELKKPRSVNAIENLGPKLARHRSKLPTVSPQGVGTGSRGAKGLKSSDKVLLDELSKMNASSLEKLEGRLMHIEKRLDKHELDRDRQQLEAQKRRAAQQAKYRGERKKVRAWRNEAIKKRLEQQAEAEALGQPLSRGPALEFVHGHAGDVHSSLIKEEGVPFGFSAGGGDQSVPPGDDEGHGSSGGGFGFTVSTIIIIII